jgi:hypothetical protein
MAPQKYFLTISFLVLSCANGNLINLTNIQETDIVDHIEFSKDSTKECYSATLFNGNMLDVTKNFSDNEEEIECYIITAPTSCTPFGTLISINDVWFSILKRKYEDQVGKLQ